MSEKVKHVTVISFMIIVILLIIMVLGRESKIIPVKYYGLDLDEEYIGIRIEHGPIVKYDTDYSEDISKFVEELNSIQIRKADWIDVLIDLEVFGICGDFGADYRITLTKRDGGEDLISIGINGNGEITYNGTEYFLKEEISEYIMLRCWGRIGKEFKKIVVQYKNESVTIEDEETIKYLEYLFDENCYNGNWDGNEKDWIYKVTATEKDGDEIDVYVISTNLIKAPDGNVYEHSDGINVRGIDEVTGIKRK